MKRNIVIKTALKVRMDYLLVVEVPGVIQIQIFQTIVVTVQSVDVTSAQKILIIKRSSIQFFFAYLGAVPGLQRRRSGVATRRRKVGQTSAEKETSKKLTCAPAKILHPQEFDCVKTNLM